jgi:ectoine hydroxylase
MLTFDHAQSFDRDGFVLIKNMFSEAEVATILAAVDRGERVKHTFNMPDTEGRSSKLSLWNDIGDDVFGAVSCSPRVVNAARMLLREDIYHWHSKVMLKEPRVGGAWEWHQDYGYWYGDGCLYPRMISCMIALDAATKENGCLKVIVGSHHLGRFDHGKRGNQAGADPERVEGAMKLMPVHYCEMPPGSALFFHCNTFHASEANTSDRPRRAYICCYNALSNVPYTGRGHGKPVPIRVAAEDAILKFGDAVAK